MQKIFRVLVNGEKILAFVFLVTRVCRISEAQSDVFTIKFIMNDDQNEMQKLAVTRVNLCYSVVSPAEIMLYVVLN